MSIFVVFSGWGDSSVLLPYEVSEGRRAIPWEHDAIGDRFSLCIEESKACRQRYRGYVVVSHPRQLFFRHSLQSRIPVAGLRSSDNHCSPTEPARRRLLLDRQCPWKGLGEGGTIVGGGIGKSARIQGARSCSV
jgi:hypothetical protein